MTCRTIDLDRKAARRQRRRNHRGRRTRTGPAAIRAAAPQARPPAAGAARRPISTPLCISNCGQNSGYFVRRLWRFRYFVNRNFGFTCRLLLSVFGPSEKLLPGTRRAEEVRFGSHGGLKAREGNGSEGDRWPQQTKQRLWNDLHPFGGASFNPGGGPFAGRGRAGRKAGGIPRRAARADVAGLWSQKRPPRKRRPFRRQGFDGPVGGGAVPDEPFPAGRAGEAARRRTATSRAHAPRTQRTGGSTQSVSHHSRVRGRAARSCPAVARVGRRFFQSAGRLPQRKPGCGGQGCKPRGVRSRVPPGHVASDLGPARLTPLLFSAISRQRSAFSRRTALWLTAEC